MFRRPFWESRRDAVIDILLAVGVGPWQPTFNSVAGGIALTAIPALLGLYISARRRLIQALTDRAERAEREQHQRAEQARAEERRRLAAEMHNVVSDRVTL